MAAPKTKKAAPAKEPVEPAEPAPCGECGAVSDLLKDGVCPELPGVMVGLTY